MNNLYIDFIIKELERWNPDFKGSLKEYEGGVMLYSKTDPALMTLFINFKNPADCWYSNIANALDTFTFFKCDVGTTEQSALIAIEEAILRHSKEIEKAENRAKEIEKTYREDLEKLAELGFIPVFIDEWDLELKLDTAVVYVAAPHDDVYYWHLNALNGDESRNMATENFDTLPELLDFVVSGGRK